ncbi:MAG: plasmid pRiA4b ORF-3 family protein [Actinomycetes bacterium]
MTDEHHGIRPDPASGLSSAQEMRLWHADILAADGVLRIADSMTLERLAGARLLINARVLLSALAEDPVTATQSLGNLPRAFVKRMLEEMSWKPLQLERFGRGDRAFYNEEEVPDLNELRVVLGLAGLLKKRHGRFSLTQKGARMLAEEQAGRLFALLLRTYFGRFNMFYGFRLQDDPEVQARIVFSLWVIGELAAGGGETAPAAGGGGEAARARPAGEPAGATTREIARVVARDELQWGMWEAAPLGWYIPRFSHMVASVILEPLEAFGLLTEVAGEEAEPFSLARDWGLETRWAATPLLADALTFELGAVERDGAAEDEAEWAAFVPTEHVTASAAFKRYLSDGASPLVDDAGPDIRLLVQAWSAFLGSAAAAPRGMKPGKAKAARWAQLSALQAVASAPTFVESMRAAELPDEPGPAMFAATMAADFACWCAENELVPESMAMRRAEEAAHGAWRLGRALRDVPSRDDDVDDDAVDAWADLAGGLAPLAEAPPPTRTPRLAEAPPPTRMPPPAWTPPPTADHARLRLVPDTRATGAGAGRIARLTVTLMETQPAVWRQIEVPASATFAQLHVFLNAAMGWEDCHLHEFGFGDRLVGDPEPIDGDGPEIEDEWELTLADALADGHRELIYTYDFGDEWLHQVHVDAVEDAAEGVFYPRCLDGARACPPEDVGGAYDFTFFLEALADPRHPEHEELADWYEEVYESRAFDPGVFDAEAVSRRLRTVAARAPAADDFDFFDAE